MTLQEDSVLAGDVLADHSLGFNLIGNSLRVMIFSTSRETFRQPSGAAVRVIFEINDAVAGGDIIDLTLSEVVAGDPNGDPVALDIDDGEVRVNEEPNVPVEGENELIFPQIANGAFPGGSFGVLMVFVNRTQALVYAEIAFFKSDGSPFVVSLIDGPTDSRFTFTVEPGGSVFLKTDAGGDLSSGYARLISTGPLGGTLVFTARDPAQTILTEAGVGASPLGDHLSVPVVFVRGGSDTGIAFVNVSDQTATLTIILRGEDGAEVAMIEVDLDPGEHLPRFASDLFALLQGEESFQGSIEILSPIPIAAIALRQQGILVTTFPVVVL